METPHKRPFHGQVLAFDALVRDFGGHTTVRGQRGADIDAACGQLKKKSHDASSAVAAAATATDDAALES